MYNVGTKISLGASPPQKLLPPPSRSLFIFGLLAALLDMDSNQQVLYETTEKVASQESYVSKEATKGYTIFRYKYLI